MSQTCRIPLRESVVPSTTCSLRILPCTVSDSTADSGNAKNESAYVDAVSEYIIGGILCQVSKRSDKRSAVGKGDLKPRRRCSDEVRRRIIG